MYNIGKILTFFSIVSLLSLGVVHAKLVAYYPFDGDANDYSGNGKNGVYWSAGSSSSTPNFVAGAKAESGNAISLRAFASYDTDGVGGTRIEQGVILPDESYFDFADAITISCWVKFNSVMSVYPQGWFAALVTKSRASDQWSLQTNWNTGAQRLAWRIGHPVGYTSTMSVRPGTAGDKFHLAVDEYGNPAWDTWYHVVTTYSSADGWETIYLDNQWSIANQSTAADKTIGDRNHINAAAAIGIYAQSNYTPWGTGDSYSNSHDGLIDEVAIFDHVLSPRAMEMLYQNNSLCLIDEPGGSTDVGEKADVMPTTDEYQILFMRQPTSPVTITVGGYYTDQISVSPPSIVVSSLPWQCSFTVTAVDDPAVEGFQITNITHTAASADPCFDWGYDPNYLPDVVVGIYEESSSGMQVNYDWMNEYDGTEQNTLALWRFNEDELIDDGGSALDLISGSYRKAVGDGSAAFAAGGKFGWGLHNVGGSSCNDRAIVQNSVNLFPAGIDPSISVECWVKFNDTPSGYIIDKQYDDNDMTGFSLAIDDTINWRLGSGTQQMVISTKLPGGIQPDTWYHIAGTWDAQTDVSRLYVNGVNVAIAVFPGQSIVNSTRSVYIGNRTVSTCSALNGVIDQVRISDVAYDYALPPQCGDPGTEVTGDCSGPQGVPDCEIDLFDLLALADDWLNNTTPDGGDAPAFFQPAPDNAAGYDPNGIYPDGRQFLVTLYSVSNPDLVNLKKDGFTAMGPSNGDGRVDIAQFLDLKYLYRVRMDPNDWGENWENMPPDPNIIAEITAQVNAAKDRDTVYLWYLMPEELYYKRANEMHYLDVASQAIRAADPRSRPIWMYEPNNSKAYALSQTIIYQDVCGEGMYVNYAGHQDERIWCRWTIEQETGAIALAHPDAIPIAVPEMFADPPDPNDDTLINSWCRHDVYCALVAGAKGVVIFSGWRRGSFERTFDIYYQGYTSVAKELNGPLNLGQVLLFGEQHNDISVAVNYGPSTMSITRPVVYTANSVNYLNLADTTGGRYLLMVNSANEPVGVTVSGLPTTGVLRREVFSSQNWIPTEGGSFTIDFAPLAVKCFRIIPEPQNCGEEGTVYDLGDITGPDGIPDCRVDIFDFALFAEKWLR